MAAQKARKAPGKAAPEGEAPARRPRPVKRQSVRKEPAFKPKPTAPKFASALSRRSSAYWTGLEAHLKARNPNDKQGRRKARKMARRVYTL